MSEDGVYPLSVPSFLSGGCRVRSGTSDPILWFEVARCSIGLVVLCGPSGPKLVFRISEFVPKFEVRMRLSGVYLMSEDGVYPSSVPSFLSEGCRVRSARQIQFWCSRWNVVALV